MELHGMEWNDDGSEWSMYVKGRTAMEFLMMDGEGREVVEWVRALDGRESVEEWRGMQGME